MDELMRHQPMLKPDAMKAIVKVWRGNLYLVFTKFSRLQSFHSRVFLVASRGLPYRIRPKSHVREIYQN